MYSCLPGQADDQDDGSQVRWIIRHMDGKEREAAVRKSSELTFVSELPEAVVGGAYVPPEGFDCEPVCQPAQPFWVLPVLCALPALIPLCVAGSF